MPSEGKTAVPRLLLDLVERFERNRQAYKSGTYNETQVRREFLDPFFTALGWDIDNKEGYAEAYKDVVHEDAIKIGDGTRAPDYCFRIGGTRKFFLEAKRPSVDIKNDASPAFQLRRYAWTTKLPLSILTDFEEFAVYDCRVKPDQKDKASVARVLYIPFTEYATRWDEIASVFSRDAVLKGSFDKYAEENKAKRGTAAVDDAFLQTIESWRKALAENLALRNKKLTQRETNFAVQRIIDRIIFLRICEGRGIEDYGKLQALADHDGIYPRLGQLFKEADDRYNSGLFHFKAEKGRHEPPDQLTLSLELDDKLLRGILKSLYYPESPYVFSALPADVLGQVYEQFLGKIIRLTEGHHAKVEDKPEVKKAHGVYYTPTYIVEYIVENTVGKLLEGKTPKQAAALRILDPACGSGSFLLGAYEYLLQWHLKFYTENDPARWARGSNPALVQASGDSWKLTIAERKRILLANIYGVDIDAQAVETTKLSLLLKVLEGETQQTLQPVLLTFQERALPDLGDNIKCGNSLIGPVFYKYQQLLSLDEEERLRINVFDWSGADGFPAVMKNGGFDAVIGNPPYSYRNATEDMLRSYYLDQYKSAEGNFELYKFFVERNVDLCQQEGLAGMIISATFLVQPTFERLRKTLLANEILLLAPLGPNVFEKATVDTAILVAKKAAPKLKHDVLVVVPQHPRELNHAIPYKVRQKRFTDNAGLVFDYKLPENAAKIVQRLLSTFPNIETGYEFGVGINTGYIKTELVAKRKLDSRYHRMVPGSGISRYGAVQTDGWIMYDAEFVRQKGSLGRTLPAEHLLSSPKILIVRTRNLSLKRRIIATMDTTGAYNLNRLSNIISRGGYSLPGLLGILNSQLFQWLFSTRFYDYEIKPVTLGARRLLTAMIPNSNR